MTRKYLRRLAAGLMTIALLGGSVACTKQSPKAEEHQVTVNGGTYKFDDGITIGVPQGSIEQDTKLAVTKPQSRPAHEAPFGKASNVAFDVSFERNAQPAAGKPLELRVPLRGNLLPKGYKPNQALFYHRLPDGKGYRLMPAKLDGDVLVAKLPHLSEWQLVWLGDEDFKTLSDINKLSPVERDGCKAEVEGKSAGKVRITQRTGWTEKSGPIKACLYVQNGEAHLSVVSRALSMLSVAATNGVKLKPKPGEESDQLLHLVAKLASDPNVKNYLASGGELTAKLTSDNVPATVQLKAEKGAALAQGVYAVLSFFVGIATGKGAGQVFSTVKAILETQETIDCLRGQMQIAKGKDPSFADVFDLVTSKCGEFILEAIDDSPTWAYELRLALAVAGAIKDGWSVFWAFYDATKMFFTGAVGVTVSPVGSACLTAGEALSAQRAYDGTSSLEMMGKIVCQSNLATARFQSEGLIKVSFFRLDRGAWQVISSGSDSYVRCVSEPVKSLPAQIKVYLPC